MPEVTKYAVVDEFCRKLERAFKNNQGTKKLLVPVEKSDVDTFREFILSAKIEVSVSARLKQELTIAEGKLERNHDGHLLRTK